MISGIKLINSFKFIYNNIQKRNSATIPKPLEMSFSESLQKNKMSVPKLRSSRHPEVFCEKDVLKNFVKFTGKHLRKSILFNKVPG